MTENEGQQIPTQEQSHLDYQAETPDVLQDTIQNVEQSVTSTADEANLARERAAFETYVKSTGGELPDNFESTNAWFNSLKEAQKNYTQGQQEISQLRQQLDQVSPAPTNTPPATKETAPQTDELRIDIPKPKTEEEEVSLFAENVSQTDWDNWTYEVATTGELLPNTKQDIIQKTGLNEDMVEDFLSAQKARMRESRHKAATIVGGKETLDNMFKWASQNLSAQEQYSINAGLSDNTMQDITLMGLQAKYNQAQSQKPIASEPTRQPTAEPMSSSAPAFMPYQTKREFSADRNNPRFGIEPDYRHAVEQRMMRTNFNTLPE